MLKSINNFRFVKAIMIAVTICIGVYISWQIGIGQLDLRQIIVICVLASIPTLMVFFRSEYKKPILFLAFFGMVLGWRGIALTPQIYIYPSELFIWLGFLLFLGETVIGERNRFSTADLPWPAVILGFTALIGIITAMAHSNQLAYAVGEAKAFIIFIPLLILLRKWVKSISDVRFYAQILVITGFVIAIFGIAERYLPTLNNILPWLFTQPIEFRNNFLAGGQVELAGFSSWGTPVVAVFLVPVVGLWVCFFRQSRGFRKVLWAIVGLAILIGIIIAGYRSAWLGLLMLAIILLLFERSSFFFLFLAGITLFYYLPRGFINRINTIVLLANSGDTSMIERTVTLKSGLNSVLHSPILGTGWNSPTPFNDWVYIAISMGLLAFFTFAIWYGVLLRKLWQIRLTKSKNSKDPVRGLSIAFLGGLAGYAVCMVSGAMSQVPPLMTGFWLVFCLAWRFTELANFNTARSLKDLHGKDINSSSNV